MEKLRALFRKYRELIAYVIVGGLTTVVSMALYYGSTWAFLDGSDALQVQIANVISWIGAVAFAYVTNRVFVFQSHSTAVFREIVSFVSSRVLTLLLDMGCMWLMVTAIGVDHRIAKLVSMVLVTVGNYVISKLLVFKKEK
ncbi:MAG: GtrA family protein [Clostridia bacterium]|nr:MAG: GtrA family protein [Clostridia bacterium]